jgi:hypothetical protein
MNRISIISDRKDYHSVLVRDGSDLVELAGKHPWPTLFKAIVRLKLKQLKKRLHYAKGKADHTGKNAIILPFDGSGAGDRQILLSSAKFTATISPMSVLLPLKGRTVNELRGTGNPEKDSNGRPPEGSPRDCA